MFGDTTESNIESIFESLPVLNSDDISPNLCSEEQIGRFEKKLPGYLEQLISSRPDLLDAFLKFNKQRNGISLEWLKEQFAEVGYENYDLVLNKLYNPALEFAIFLGGVHLMQNETGPIYYWSGGNLDHDLFGSFTLQAGVALGFVISSGAGGPRNRQVLRKISIDEVMKRNNLEKLNVEFEHGHRAMHQALELGFGTRTVNLAQNFRLPPGSSELNVNLINQLKATAANLPLFVS